MIAELRVHLPRLVHRHLLRCRYRTDRGAYRILEQVEDLPRLAPHEPGAERFVRCGGHPQVLQAVTGRGRVDDDRVPLATARRLKLLLVPDLADRHQLLQPRRGGDEVAVELAADDHPLHALHRQHEPEILAERRLAVDREEAEAGEDFCRRLGAAVDAEHLAETAARTHLRQQHALAALGERDREERGDGALPDAAFADDEEHPPLEEVVSHSTPFAGSRYHRPG